MIVAIDGVTGSGKSTISKALAKKVGFAYIRTGSFYRALAYQAISNNIKPDDEPKITKMLQNTKIDADFTGQHVKICVNEKDVSDKLNSQEISIAASVISTLKPVRKYVSALQKQSAEIYPNIIMEGRDIGYVVFPNADLKVYIYCDIDERARRRKAQFEQNGEIGDINKIKNDILQRDYNDMNRKISPLVRLPEAFYLDTTSLSIEQCVDLLNEQIKNAKQHKN